MKTIASIRRGARSHCGHLRRTFGDDAETFLTLIGKELPPAIPPHLFSTLVRDSDIDPSVYFLTYSQYWASRAHEAGEVRH